VLITKFINSAEKVITERNYFSQSLLVKARAEISQAVTVS